MSNILKVWVDTREKKEMVDKTLYFFRNKGCETFSAALGDYGDLSLLLRDGRYVNIERKSYQDYVTSYISHHIQDQAIRMNNSCDIYCTIVHGSFEDIKRLQRTMPQLRRITEKSVEKMTEKLEIFYAMPVFFVSSKVQYWQKAYDIAEMAYKTNNETLLKHSKAKMESRPDIDILTIPSRIGKKTAIKLLKEFKTPKNVLEASREDLLKINGIGDSTIADLKKLHKVYEGGLDGAKKL